MYNDARKSRKAHSLSPSYHRGFSSRGSRYSRAPKKSWTHDHTLLVKKAQSSDINESRQVVGSFEGFAISGQIKENVRLHGYVSPTPIQDQVIPYILEGRDVVGIANTGTGKTAAFLIPLINKIQIDRSQRALIIAPTRELAVQIKEEFSKFSRGMLMTSLLCIGGVNINPQIKGLRSRVDVLIGTPGRLKDLENRGVLNFNSYNNIVLDEVDRMLDMGFVHDVKYIVSRLSQVRQSLFFSATLSLELESIMRSFIKDPVNVSVKSQETASNVDQDIVKLNGRSKLDLLHDLLIQDGFDKVLVFGRTKWGVERLSKQLAERGFGVAALHGNKTHGQRQRALEQFKSNQIRVLLATDVASRGLDIANVSHVINYDLPETYEDYVHRIGRTGRADKSGVALSFID
jgi:superfamily II DNA/RNA helicase